MILFLSELYTVVIESGVSLMLVHKLEYEDETPILAKDANKAKGDDWFEIYDPRNPINQRRREASRQAMQQKKSEALAKHAQLR
ncbi:hypothetical protein J437_LFUL002286 [Ladona fulva]|uniref:Uncharacterized protein n=1 Tax=Ladona fulva TaxID=123851 RepID=A0A8K0NYU3_LADFU|nr:hypothetical protein J437_LFUL002286 [Ladona fulva]